MSDRDEPRDKITVLFPEGADTPSEDGAGDGEEVQENLEEPGGGDSVGGGENVVHLDFQRDTTRRSPRPDVDSDFDADPEDLAKLKVFSRIIEEGMVMVTLDTRPAEVEVPPKFRGLPELRLNFSHLFQIDDFTYDARGVRASLSFQGKRHFCDLPWPAVFMLYSHQSGEVFIFEPGQ